MNAPYYSDEFVTLYHGDCREITEWLAADVLVTDPPYGRAWRHGDTNTRRGRAASDAHAGIANDLDSAVRDTVLEQWANRPAMVFGDLMLPPPVGVKHVLIYDKGACVGFTGAIAGFRRNAEAVYLLGKGWPSGLGGRSCIVSTLAPAAGRGRAGHPHTKPLDVMEQLITVCPAGVIADPCAGSGSTLLAAKRLGHKSIGVELEERYCEIAARRLDQNVLPFGEAS